MLSMSVINIYLTITVYVFIGFFNPFFVNIALTIMFRGSQRILVYIRIFLSPKNFSSVRIS